MASLSNQEVVDRYLEAHQRHDYEALGRLLEPMRPLDRSDGR